MKNNKFSLLLIISIFILLYPAQETNAYPSEGFTKKRYYWYDDWNINRNSAEGDDGYLPAVVFESLGQNRELAYQYGNWFLSEYPDQVTRAEKIMSFVQSMVKYEYDEESLFVLAVTGNDVQEEWAWNPDEMAHMIDTAYNNYDVTNGDCEDFAFLLTVIYYAAGYNVTIVDAIDHAALLIYLPEYPDANIYWNIGDGRGAGWIWVEATGDRNPLGWTPDDYKYVDFTVNKLQTGLYLLEVQENDSDGLELIDCLISMATRKSELEGEVQSIREFRDNQVKSTFVGSQFTGIFNVWYYSFSPAVADYIAKDQTAKLAVKGFLYPLMGIMHVSFFVQNFLAFNSELSVVMAILTASLLIGVIYFSLPMMLLVALINRHVCFMGNNDNKKRLICTVLIISLLACLVMIGISEFSNASQLMMASTGMLALTSILTAALIVGINLAERILPIN